MRKSTIRSLANCWSSAETLEPPKILLVVEGVPKAMMPRDAPPKPPAQSFSADSTDMNPSEAAN